HAILLDLAAHRAALQNPAPPHCVDGRRDGDAGDRHDRPGRTAAPHPLLNEAHCPSSRLLIERALAKIRRAPRDPRGLRDARVLIEELDGGYPTADVQNMAPNERSRS